jgi:hypothetical protein
MSGLRSRQERKADVLTALAQNRDLWLPSAPRSLREAGDQVSAGMGTMHPGLLLVCATPAGLA